jgi:hypothetical protein
MSRIKLSPQKPISFKDFAIKHNINGENYLAGGIEHGQWLEQIVPSAYLRQNEFYSFDFNTAMRGMVLQIFSLKDYLIFTLEVPDAIYERDYDITKSEFIDILQINRIDIISFEKKENVHFMAVKPKKSLKVMNGLRGAPVGGLIPGLIIRGIFSAASKVEDDLVEKPGTRFVLKFESLGLRKELDLIIDEFYVNAFEKFLSENWVISSPEPMKVEKEGCFIATACYNDYHHPIVVQLRNFRDQFLQKKKFGRQFIKLYYLHSPKYAKLIQRKIIVKLLLRFLLIKPLYYLSKVIISNK